MKAKLLQPNGKPTGVIKDNVPQHTTTIYEKDQIYRFVEIKREGFFRQKVGYYKLSES